MKYKWYFECKGKMELFKGGTDLIELIQRALSCTKRQVIKDSHKKIVFEKTGGNVLFKDCKIKRYLVPNGPFTWWYYGMNGSEHKMNVTENNALDIIYRDSGGIKSCYSDNGLRQVIKDRDNDIVFDINWL